MRNHNRKGSRSGLSSILRTMTVATLVAVGCGVFGVSASASIPVGKKISSPIVLGAKKDLAKRLKVRTEDIKVVSVNATTWPNAALGMPEIGQMYAEVITPGSKIILEGQGDKYLYLSNTKTFRYGGPTDSWNYSVLYTQPVKNDANLNSDLYQCSLMGTNPLRVASEVSDYYPQSKGVVIIKRRTSRSGHDILLVKADGKDKGKRLHSAMDFGDVALNDAQDQWAAFVKPGLGKDWAVQINRVGDDGSKVQSLPMPEGVRPGKIAWSGENIVILSKKNDLDYCAQISPKAAAPEWKKIAMHEFPGLPDYMLNKSESLDIKQITEDGKPIVEVARVWFTGDRNVVARISNFTMRGETLMGRYAIIWGEKDGKPAVCAVNYGSEETLPCFGGVSRDIKPFSFPVHDSPLTSTETN